MSAILLTHRELRGRKGGHMSTGLPGEKTFIFPDRLKFFSHSVMISSLKSALF